jgi:hypothetical protein
MNYNLNLGLKGEYKVDIYSGKKFVETTDWFSNDITNWGLTYPFTYSFARCFMFLSLGSVAGTNNQTGTGLLNPIKEFDVVSNNGEGQLKKQSGQYIGWEGYEIGADKNSSLDEVGATTCGTIITNKGVRMYRGWTIPTGNSSEENVIGGNGLTINQFMVSPSSGSDEKGNKAFSLVNREIVIPSGYSATITYQLSIDFINYSDPYTFFSGKNVAGTNGFFDTGKAVTGVNGSNEIELLSSWSNLSGIFRQVSPGFEIVDGVGACIRPTNMGNDLEPYRVNCSNTFFYLSPDISQFCLNKIGTYSDQLKAYNSIGLMANYYEFASENNYILSISSNSQNASAYVNPEEWFYSGESIGSVNRATTTEFAMPENPRLNGIINISNYATGELDPNGLTYKTKNYTGAKNFPVAFATPGKIGFNASFPDFGQKFVRSTSLKRLPIDPVIKGTGTRFKYVTKKAIISPLYCYGTNSRYGSLTLGYNSQNTNDIDELSIYPYIDFLFFDNEGRGANMAHYRYVPTIYLKDRGTGIAKIRFDIIGEDGNKPDSINRFYSVYGFMGSGVNTNINSSGLDQSNPLISLDNIMQDGGDFVPPGPKTSGFLFPGQVLNENVPGDINYNNGTGYGSVYGIIANSGFYTYSYDLCLLDIPNWSGLNGNPSGTIIYNFSGSTGFTGNLCWPHYSKKIKLKFEELEYINQFSGISNLGNISDSGGSFGEPNKKLIFDITGTGLDYSSLFNNNNYTNTKRIWIATGNGTSINDVLRTVDVASYTNLNFIFSGSLNRVCTGYMTTGASGNYIFFSGFKDNFPLSGRGSGLGFSNSDINGFFISGINTTALKPISLLYGSPISLQKLPYSAIKCVSDNLKRPEAYIYHVETTGGNIGYRILPNYAIANTGNSNKYNAVTGGTFPGLSIENGMELYLTLSWTGV